MAAPLVLARTFADAHRYAREELGLSFGYYRVVNSVGTLKAVRNVDLHLVPGWEKRPGHFAFKSALRYCRLNIIDVANRPAEEPVEQPPTIEITVVPDDTPVPQHHVDMVAKMLPADSQNGTENGTVVTGHDPVGDFFVTDGSMSVETPEAEPAAEDVEAAAVMPEPEQAAEVLESEPEKPTKRRRRTRCKDCGNLHFKEEACPPSEDA